MAKSIARVVWGPLFFMLFILSGCSAAKTDTASSADQKKIQSQSSLDALRDALGRSPLLLDRGGNRRG